MTTTSRKAAPDPGDAAPKRKEKSAKGPRRPGLAHAVALVRTTAYSVVATAWFMFITLAGFWILLMPNGTPRAALDFWAASDLWLLKVIAGQRIEVLGRENVPQGAALVASKHQAEWETMALLPILPKGVVILKKELLSIPLYGWYARHFGMIPIDRSAGASALKHLAVDAAAAMWQGRQLVIFPEGTRRLVGAPPDYKPGAIFLYEKLKVPMVPVALNSGLFWPRHRFVRYPGTVTVSFLPPIPPGLSRADARRQLEASIETETARLVARADPVMAYEVRLPGERAA